MTDRAKTRMFDALGSYFGTPGSLPEIDVLDVYAGTGQLGLESLSRGAGRCLFVESDRRAQASLAKNIASLPGAGDHSSILKQSVHAVNFSSLAGRWNWALLFLDPPYPHVAGGVGGTDVATLTDKLATSGCLADGCIALLRHPHTISVGDNDIPSWRIARHTTIGTMGITWLEYPGT